ncbi:hypothetical protein PHSC3_002048 [Chlamydiales bacterium STE3]|nr:hypothetical protein PHSC3_002048 [Chlamydiales bacterium STE3]
MHKETTYKEKLVHLGEWLPSIIETIKKDLKNEHLKQDFQFVKKYFPGKNINKIESEELSGAYKAAIEEQENGEMLAEFIASRWIIKNSDLYYFFENFLSSVDPNFTEIVELDERNGEKLIEEATVSFGAKSTYVFSVLNSVAFTRDQFSKLQSNAQKETATQNEERVEREEKATIEGMKRNQEREIARLTDKYEKKLAGLQKKYIQDVEQLKRQVANLQKKLHV